MVTYMSNVNLIFVSRSPINIFVKFSTNARSVTYSFVFYLGFLRLMGVFLTPPFAI